ncbi:Retrovirus-related Pol polyprotein from transposon TNT 1-94 [Cryptotermes secundus]|uniref:Retrovirus-related Pol polyprotein from transposon TNT 1-94 n=2 Tax=Cryptotermes secundus TaxID=105785 RepID=A0A2J7R8S8_9NEOP|nr:Retrovirus-related Pol polyprotein from transposon TNT 1-94 [Cryptotermes secundus]
MSNPTATLPPIEKLDGRLNYSDWKFGMMLYLKELGIWNSVNGYPTGDTTTETQKTQHDATALIKIGLMVKPICYPIIRDAETAKSAWEKLSVAFEDDGLNRRCQLLRKLGQLRLEQFKNLTEYTHAFVDIADKLRSMKKPLDDEFVAAMMLANLPDRFEPMRQTYDNCGITISTDLISRKLQEYDDTNLHSKEDVALLSHGKERFPRKPKCWLCGEIGHVRMDCPKKVQNSSKQGTKKSFSKQEDKMSAKKEKTSRRENSYFAALTLETNDDSSWYVDSGATSHLTSRLDWFKKEKEMTGVEVFTTGTNKLECLGSGSVRVKFKNDDSISNISSVLYVPEARTNLLSVSKLVDKGHVVVFEESGCRIYSKHNMSIKGNVLGTASKVGNLFKMDVEEMERVNLAKTDKDENYQLWHKRLGHINPTSMKIAKNGVCEGICFNDTVPDTCISCIKGKFAKKPFRARKSKAKGLLDVIHSDLCGPMEVESWNGAKYILTFTDEFSRKVFVYFIKSKSEVFTVFCNFKALVENQVGKTIKALRTDNGGEYISKHFSDYLEQNGIEHHVTVPYNPQQNGLAERVNRSLCEMARCLMSEAKCNKRMWAEAINTATYIKNRVPHKALINKTPQECWSGEKTNVSHFKVFGCVAYMHVPKENRLKWDSKSKGMCFVGYCEKSGNYRLIDLSNPKSVTFARDVIFLENVRASVDEENVNASTDFIKPSYFGSEISDSGDQPDAEKVLDDSTVNLNESDHTPVASVLSDAETDDVLAVPVQQVENEPGTMMRVRRPPLWLQDYETNFMTVESFVDNCPDSYSSAVRGPDKNNWKRAMKEEYDALIQNNTWNLVELPKGKKAISCKWVYVVKKDLQSDPKYKARLVARGFSQIDGIDYNETYSPVVGRSVIRFLLALTVELNLKMYSLDICTAFLNGELEEEIYMTQPEGFTVEGLENKVCLLNKALYGLKQASRTWNTTITKELVTLGYEVSVNEPCMFYRKMDDSFTVLALYVDDFLIVTNDISEKERLVKKLGSKFRLKDLGETKYLLGMRIRKRNGSIYVDQEEYICKILEKFAMINCKNVSTPLPAGCKLDRNNSDKLSEIFSYQSLVGCLNYLALIARPDIAFAASFLGQYNSCATAEHWKCAKHVLRYLRKTKDLCLVYSKTGKSIVGYSDSDYANGEDRKSYSGNIFELANGPISWEAKKQKSVALSTTESEYIALSEACKEGVFLRKLLMELLNDDSPILMNVDNQSCIKLASNPVFHSRCKHIDVRYHYVREVVQNGLIDLEYVPTEIMKADIMTKSLPKVKHEYLLDALGMKPFDCIN